MESINELLSDAQFDQRSSLIAEVLDAAEVVLQLRPSQAQDAAYCGSAVNRSRSKLVQHLFHEIQTVQQTILIAAGAPTRRFC